MVYINKRILLSHKKKGILLFATNLDEPRGHYAKWNKSDREIQILNENRVIYSLNREGKMTRELDEGDKEVQNFSYKIYKYRYEMHSVECIVNNYVICLYGDRW